MDPETYLYHYTTREAALGSILPQRQMRLGPFSWTNDPREAKDWFLPLEVRTGSPTAEESGTAMRGAARRMGSLTKVGCFTQDDAEGMVAPHENFGRGWGHSRMWAQYAGNHTGACLIFYRSDLERTMSELETTGRVWHGPVRYENRPFVEPLDYDAIARDGLEAAVERYVDQHVDDLFFVKNGDWAAEYEYRWVLRNEQPGPLFVDIGDALAAVVVGEAFPSRDEETLEHLAQSFSPPGALGRCHWINGAPQPLPLGFGG